MPRTLILALLLIASSALPIPARAAEQVARSLATALRQVMLQYDAAVELKAAKEEQFYLAQRQTLRDLWLPGALPSESQTNFELNTVEAVKKSVPYSTIFLSAQRSANELSQKLASAPAEAGAYALLVDALIKGEAEDQALLSKAQIQQQTLRVELGATLAQIDLQDARRKSIRDSLVKLEAAPTLNQQLTQLYNVGQTAIKQWQQKPKPTPAN